MPTQDSFDMIFFLNRFSHHRLILFVPAVKKKVYFYNSCALDHVNKRWCKGISLDKNKIIPLLLLSGRAMLGLERFSFLLWAALKRITNNWRVTGLDYGAVSRLHCSRDY